MTDTSAAFVVSAFGDEIDPDLDTQLDLMSELKIGHLELRAAWGTNVLKMDGAQVARVVATCLERGVAVSCIGSPVGKTAIDEPLASTLADLERICETARAVGTRYVRIFSFYPPEGQEGRQGEYVEESTARLGAMSELAGKSEVTLILENEIGVVGDTPERCRVLLEGVDSPWLRFVWDTANFVHVGVERPVDRSWELLSPYVEYVQIKDYNAADDKVVPAGEGDAQVPVLLAKLRDVGYRGYLALEPHLALAGRSSGFSGPEGMRVAARALRTVMSEQGCREVERLS